MKLKLLFIGLVLVTFNSFGQSLEFTDRVLDKMVLDVNLDGSGMITKEIAHELKLTQEQYREVELVNKNRFQQIIQAEEKFAGNPDLLSRTFNEINSTYDRALSSVLSAEQQERLLSLSGSKLKLCYSVNQQE